MQQRLHKKSGVRPPKALKYAESKQVLDFILHYAEMNAVQLPGRSPKRWAGAKVQLLPADTTKRSVFDLYTTAAASAGYRLVCLSTFRTLWRTLCPFICVQKPGSDLCWYCQQAGQRLQQARNNEAAKQKVAMEHHHHLKTVKQERQFYRDCCLKAQAFPSIGCFRHISFDFAQQVHYPFDSQQPGPIFFKTPRKCGLFGINSEGDFEQVNYLVDEAHSCGKGANTVISYLHDYLENQTTATPHLHIHADNCAGQNKNNYMLQYLMWRCCTGKNIEIVLSFLIAGHTKFSPDGGFGLIKQKLRVSKVDCLQDLKTVVNTSSKMNKPVLVGDECGTSHVSVYDWKSFLAEKFKPLPGIKKCHFFRFGQSSIVEARADSAAAGELHNLRREGVTASSDLPDPIQPPGLSKKRQWYLYRQIREFVSPDKQDIVCPLPEGPEVRWNDDEADEPDDAGMYIKDNLLIICCYTLIYADQLYYY